MRFTLDFDVEELAEMVDDCICYHPDAPDEVFAMEYDTKEVAKTIAMSMEDDGFLDNVYLVYRLALNAASEAFGDAVHQAISEYFHKTANKQ